MWYIGVACRSCSEASVSLNDLVLETAAPPAQLLSLTIRFFKEKFNFFKNNVLYLFLQVFFYEYI